MAGKTLATRIGQWDDLIAAGEHEIAIREARAYLLADPVQVLSSTRWTAFVSKHKQLILEVCNADIEKD